jgi:hypothetical protein
MEIIKAKGSEDLTKMVRFLEEETADGNDGEKHNKNTDDFGDKDKVKKKEKSIKFSLEKDDETRVETRRKRKLTEVDVCTKKDKTVKRSKSVQFSIEEEDDENDDSKSEALRQKCSAAVTVEKSRKRKESESSSEEDVELSGADDTSDEDEGEGSDDYVEPKPKLKEDIYGRLVDAKGNVYKECDVSRGGGAYVPPAKRLAIAHGSEKKKIELERLKKQLKGLLNRFVLKF